MNHTQRQRAIARRIAQAIRSKTPEARQIDPVTLEINQNGQTTKISANPQSVGSRSGVFR